MPLLRRVLPVLARVIATSRKRGVLDVLASSGGWGRQWVTGRPRPGRAPGVFAWGGRTLPYFAHRYHYTWLNERAVEVSLALDLLQQNPGADVLEIGNVLGHYADVTHPVVDKYEQAPGVLNADVADLDMGRDFDLVLAISTLEHVGLDEDVFDPGKPARAIERLRAHVRPGGMLWITHPLGYNTTFDDQLRSGRIPSSRLRALRRDARRNVWREVPPDEVWGTSYDRLLYTAHAVLVVEMDAPQIV